MMVLLERDCRGADPEAVAHILGHQPDDLLVIIKTCERVPGADMASSKLYEGGYSPRLHPTGQPASQPASHSGLSRPQRKRDTYQQGELDP